MTRQQPDKREENNRRQQWVYSAPEIGLQLVHHYNNVYYFRKWTPHLSTNHLNEQKKNHNTNKGWRFLTQIMYAINENQAGFRRDYSRTEHIFTILILFELLKLRKQIYCSVYCLKKLTATCSSVIAE